MISANNVTLRIGKKALFEDVNIKFTQGNCYGLIGANGAGKSTFLKILSGQLEPTKGDIVITPGERLSFLQQDHFKYDEYTVLDTVIMGNKRLYEIMKEKDAIYAKEDFTEEDGIKASELEGEFATMNGWEAESDAATLLNGLGIETELHYKLMKELKKLGFKISIDDFGSGFSSLNMLKDLPIDVLKLDKEFFPKGDMDERVKTIFVNVVRMTKELNIIPLTEGVETKEQAEFLREVGCVLAQGYYYSRPLPEADFIKYLSEHEIIEI